MKTKLHLLVPFCILAFTADAQKDTAARFTIGDAAPALRVQEWIKGTPVHFEKGKVYVIDFWATWCAPCRASMPHLSKLARKYHHKVTFAAIDVFESHATKHASVTAFVNRQGRRMNFNIATEDTNLTAHDWIGDDWSIPTTFVIDRQGKVAWIGHPHNLDTVLWKIVSNTWDIKAALSELQVNDRLEKLDTSVISKVARYQGRYSHLDDLGHPDSTLFIIDEIVKKEPRIKYTPWMVRFTFSALLRTDPQKAYEYARQAVVTTTYERPACNMIIDDIISDSRIVNMTKDIYRLGAECYQQKMDQAYYPELMDRATMYRQMAEWYRLAGDKIMALKADKKAYKIARKQL